MSTFAEVSGACVASGAHAHAIALQNARECLEIPILAVTRPQRKARFARADINFAANRPRRPLEISKFRRLRRRPGVGRVGLDKLAQKCYNGIFGFLWDSPQIGRGSSKPSEPRFLLQFSV